MYLIITTYIFLFCRLCGHICGHCEFFCGRTPILPQKIQGTIWASLDETGIELDVTGVEKLFCVKKLVKKADTKKEIVRS